MHVPTVADLADKLVTNILIVQLSETLQLLLRPQCFLNIYKCVLHFITIN